MPNGFVIIIPAHKRMCVIFPLEYFIIFPRAMNKTYNTYSNNNNSISNNKKFVVTRFVLSGTATVIAPS